MAHTVTTNDRRGDVTPAARLASEAARTVGALTTSAVSDVERAQLAALSSIALSLADPPLPRFASQIGTAEPEPAAGTVPLASADTLPEDVVNDLFVDVFGFVPSDARLYKTRRIVDAVNAKLREQFPDETPTQPEAPAPFVRGVDELSDDEFIEAYRALTGFAAPWVGPADATRARAFYSAIAARLRVDGPGREHVFALGDLPALAEADREAALGQFQLAHGMAAPPGVTPADTTWRGIRHVIDWYRARYSGGPDPVPASPARVPLAATSYDPATLAPGSVVVAGGKVCLNVGDGTERNWIVAPVAEKDYEWVRIEDVPTDGVLVVDGATLGGAQ